MFGSVRSGPSATAPKLDCYLNMGISLSSIIYNLPYKFPYSSFLNSCKCLYYSYIVFSSSKYADLMLAAYRANLHK